ncbi:MAG: lysophospholipase, partial [Ginsengibacter sp.]
YNPITKKNEVVYTYGYYMRKYVRDCKAKKAIPIICSPIPRNEWQNGKVERSDSSYSGWAKAVAQQEGAYFINLNDLVALKYEEIGAEKVKSFFPADHTHTDMIGAKLNAGIVVNSLTALRPGKLKKYILNK